MGRDLEIADRARSWGLTVVEVDNWRTRGKDNFSPINGVWHHTAGGNGNAPSLGVCINGRPDLPGPLCHSLQARDDTFFIIASGTANHAGKGSWAGVSGNSRAWGLEIELRGTAAEPLSINRFTNACKWMAAMIEDRADISHCCEHSEWAPDRKVDVYGYSGDQFRDQTLRLLSNSPPIEEDDMYALSLCPDGVGGILPVVGSRTARKLIVTVDAGDQPSTFRIVPLAAGILDISDPWTVRPWSRGEYLLPNGTTHVRVIFKQGQVVNGALVAEAHIE